jgi:hypothetical protein
MQWCQLSLHVLGWASSAAFQNTSQKGSGRGLDITYPNPDNAQTIRRADPALSTWKLIVDGRFEAL